MDQIGPNPSEGNQIVREESTTNRRKEQGREDGELLLPGAGLWLSPVAAGGDGDGGLGEGQTNRGRGRIGVGKGDGEKRNRRKELRS